MRRLIVLSLALQEGLPGLTIDLQCQSYLEINYKLFESSLHAYIHTHIHTYTHT